MSENILKKAGQYQIAYGRRRLAAAIELGLPVRAIVKPLTDDQLVIAQGQENSARKDLSYIEKALFAVRLEQRSFSRKIIMSSLAVDKTGLSRLISAAENVPRDLIEAIGSAPSIGRGRWIELATRLKRPRALAKAHAAVAGQYFGRLDPDARFNRVFVAVAPPKPKKAVRPSVLTADDGAKLARIKEDERTLALIIDKKAGADFAAHLVKILPAIYQAFKRHNRQSED